MYNDLYDNCNGALLLVFLPRVPDDWTALNKIWTLKT